MEGPVLPPPPGAGTPTKFQHFPLRLPACETDGSQTCKRQCLPHFAEHGAVHHRLPPGQRAAERAARKDEQARTAGGERGILLMDGEKAAPVCLYGGRGVPGGVLGTFSPRKKCLAPGRETPLGDICQIKELISLAGDVAPQRDDIQQGTPKI